MIAALNRTAKLAAQARGLADSPRRQVVLLRPDRFLSEVDHQEMGIYLEIRSSELFGLLPKQ